MTVSDVLELLALACVTVAAFAIFALPGVLTAAGVSFFYLARVYSSQPRPAVKLPKLSRPKLPALKRGDDA